MSSPVKGLDVQQLLDDLYEAYEDGERGETVVEAVTPHGSYTFVITGVEIIDNVPTLRLQEIRRA